MPRRIQALLTLFFILTLGFGVYLADTSTRPLSSTAQMIDNVLGSATRWLSGCPLDCEATDAYNGGGGNSGGR